MNGLSMTQNCPYCKHEVEDYYAVWKYEAEEDVKCDNCQKEYVVKPQYEFVGFQIEKQCEACGEWTDDGMYLCDCEIEEKNRKIRT